MKARQTVFFAYKSPAATSSLERERDALMQRHPIWENMWQKLAVSRWNGAHGDFSSWTHTVAQRCQRRGQFAVCVCAWVCARVQWVKTATWCFAARPRTPPCKRACPLAMTTTSGMPQRPPNLPIVHQLYVPRARGARHTEAGSGKGRRQSEKDTEVESDCSWSGQQRRCHNSSHSKQQETATVSEAKYCHQRTLAKGWSAAKRQAEIKSGFEGQQ